MLEVAERLTVMCEEIDFEDIFISWIISDNQKTTWRATYFSSAVAGTIWDLSFPLWTTQDMKL